MYTAIIIFDIAALLAVYLPASYTATAIVVMNASDTPVTPSAQQQKTDTPESSSDVQTEMAIMTSRDIAVRVIDYLHLEGDPDMRKLIGGGSWFGRLLGISPPQPTGPLSPEDRATVRDRVIAQIARNLDVERVSSAYAVSVAYTDSNPVRAASIANAVAHFYTADQIKLKATRNADAVRLLGDRIRALRDQAQMDYDAVQRYRIQNNLLSTTGATLTEQEISAYNQRVADARADAVADAAKLNTALGQLRRGSNGGDVGEALSSPVIQSLRVKRAELSGKVADYAGTLGPKNPDLHDALRELSDVDIAIQSEIDREVSNLSAKKQVSRQRLGSLSGSLGTARGTLAQNNHAMVALDDLQRKADTSQALYESYLTRYKEAYAANGAERADSRTVSDARIPRSPSFPNVPLFLLLGAVLGVGTGFVAAILVELGYSGLTSGDEVRQRLGVAFLGGVPDLKTVKPRGKDVIETMRDYPRSAMSEALRGILAKIHQSGPDCRVVMVTSALADEGKTTTVAGLALAASRSGERVIVVDCDSVRRRFSQRYAARADATTGLYDVLAGKVTIAAAIIDDPLTGAQILPILPTGDDSAEHLDATRMRALLMQLREHFQLVLLDSGPLLPVAETRELAQLADAVVLVSRWRKTSDKAIAAALDLLPPDALARAGVVLTKINMRKQSRFTKGDASAFYHSYQSYYHAH